MVDEETVKHMSRLSKLGLAESEIPLFQEKFVKVMDVVNAVKSVDTTGVEPMRNPLDLSAHVREDKITAQNEREALLSEAPDAEQGYFKVPKVIE